jgi:hypothetical protein
MMMETMFIVVAALLVRTIVQIRMVKRNAVMIQMIAARIAPAVKREISALQLKAGLKPAWSAVNLSKQIAAELKQIKSPVRPAYKVVSTNPTVIISVAQKNLCVWVIQTLHFKAKPEAVTK